MPVTHGSTLKSSDLAVSFIWTHSPHIHHGLDAGSAPTLHELDAAEPREESVLSVAVQRARDERRDPRPVQATFDNKLSR